MYEVFDQLSVSLINCGVTKDKVTEYIGWKNVFGLPHRRKQALNNGIKSHNNSCMRESDPITNSTN